MTRRVLGAVALSLLLGGARVFLRRRMDIITSCFLGRDEENLQGMDSKSGLTHTKARAVACPPKVRVEGVIIKARTRVSGPRVLGSIGAARPGTRKDEPALAEGDGAHEGCVPVQGVLGSGRAESAAALDGHVRVHQSHAPPFSLAMPSGLARSQQLYMMQRFLNIPATPSYVKAEDGMVLDRVIANVGGRTWWHTLTLQLSGRSARGTRSPSTRADPTASSATLRSTRWGGRFRAGFSRHTVLKAFGSSGSLKGPPRKVRRLATRIPTRPIPTSPTPPGRVTNATTTAGDEIPRGRVTLRSTAIPYHVFTADWSRRERSKPRTGTSRARLTSRCPWRPGAPSTSTTGSA